METSPKRHQIPVQRLLLKSYSIWDRSWFLLTSGDFAGGKFNTMTVSWGSLGCIWNKPFAQVFVRPVRYTFEFIEKYPDFTLSVFNGDYARELNLLGSKSGRDGDKIAMTGLTPIASQTVAAPSFKQADLVLECRKMYWSDLQPEHFLDPDLIKHYPDKDFHRTYYGEILAAYGTDSYSA
jgi:flavin reductase (DIM6/NTAB) family NADH-FMN oxidoreductase RutF